MVTLFLNQLISNRMVFGKVSMITFSHDFFPVQMSSAATTAIELLISANSLLTDCSQYK